MGWFKALKSSIYALFSMQKLNGERPEQADVTGHRDNMQCRHCGHVHKEPDGSCACGCSLLEL